MIINACNGTPGDLYNTAICILLALGSVKVVQAISMPLDVNEYVWLGCMLLGTQIIVPPLLSPVCHISLLFWYIMDSKNILSSQGC